MFEYIKGIVTDIKPNGIVLENNGIGYFIYVSNPYIFNVNNEYKVYIYEHILENEDSLYGFKTSKDKELFLKLISVKGLGPKMTLPLLVEDQSIESAIEREDITYLKKFPKIGDKLAKQIVLDLKGKLSKDENIKTNDELKEALLGLGYKEKEIKNVISKVDNSLSIEEQIKVSLKLLLK